MKSKSIFILFVLIGLALAAVFFVTEKVLNRKDDSVTRAKVITPKSSNQTEAESEKKLSSLDNEKYETFVPLYPTETLISTQNMDLNNDGYDDEVVLVKKVGSQYMWIIPGIYVSETGNYDRLDQIVTPFSRTRTFSYSGMDVIGDHRNALIYQGVDDEGNYVMSIFLCKEQSNGTLKLVSIGDFASDGTIFIQQTERSDNYELGITKGEAFSVWVYKSEEVDEENTKDKAAQNQNQIQQEYKWNPVSGRYELSQEIKVTAKRLAAKELSRIQDGTVETFAAFLDGLWYKVSNEDGNIRYVFFDYETKEIIQFIGDVQEVYEWEDSKIRHNGIYLTTVNSDIMNLHRRFDVSLVNVDEIKITIRDDVRLNITQNSVWDGQYKKMNLQSSFADSNKTTVLETFEKELKKDFAWLSSDEVYTIKFFDENYELRVGELVETGIYALMRIGDYNVIQFRSDLDNSALQEYYSMSFGTKIITETVKKKQVERTITDYDSISFTPVKITPTDCFSSEGHILSLSR